MGKRRTRRILKLKRIAVVPAMNMGRESRWYSRG